MRGSSAASHSYRLIECTLHHRLRDRRFVQHCCHPTIGGRQPTPTATAHHHHRADGRFGDGGTGDAATAPTHTNCAERDASITRVAGSPRGFPDVISTDLPINSMTLPASCSAQGHRRIRWRDRPRHIRLATPGAVLCRGRQLPRTPKSRAESMFGAVNAGNHGPGRGRVTMWVSGFWLGWRAAECCSR